MEVLADEVQLNPSWVLTVCEVGKRKVEQAWSIDDLGKTILFQNQGLDIRMAGSALRRLMAEYKQMSQVLLITYTVLQVTCMVKPS